jgi:excisionase family DNA binding protein
MPPVTTLRNGARVGLLAQASVPSPNGVPRLSGISATRPATCPTFPARLLPVKARKGRQGAPAQVGAAEYLGVSMRSVWRLVDAGHLRPVRLPGLRCVAFDVRELDALIEASRD